MSRRRLLALALPLLALAGCGGGGGSSAPAGPTIHAARIYHIAGFRPSGPLQPNRPTALTFTIVQPDGRPLTHYKTGPGPHTGVHLIYVRKDLSTIIHHHPPLHGTGGKIVDSVTFPAPGPYRLVIDVYPANCPEGSAPSVPGAPRTCNFQLFETVHVAGAYHPLPLPPTSQVQTAGGCRFSLAGASHLTAIQAQLVHVTVTCGGKPAHFETYYGALAHAIFFRRGSLDYFHTHVCAPGVSGCTSFLGGTKVTGRSATPGKLTVGVLVPVSGTWRLFLQAEVGGKVVTAPFTLHVA